jgi:hypothetical protein
MTHSETTQQEGLLADAFLRRHTIEPRDFYQKQKPRRDLRRVAYARLYGKGRRAACLAHNLGHEPNPWRQCVRNLKSYRLLARLEDAATAKNEIAFVSALNSVDLRTRPARHLVRIIKLALRAGAYLAARNVAENALRRYPENAEFKEYVFSLSPPKIISQAVPHNPAFQANREWLNEHATEYSGQWIALRSGELLGASTSFEELFSQIGRSKEILFTRA